MTLDATAVADLVRRGEVHPAQIAEAASRQNEATHPVINAVVEWYDDAQFGRTEGALAGVPFLRKDYGSAEAGRLVEMGSVLAAGHRATETARYYQALEAEGLSVVGRSAVPEFIQHGTTETRVFGATRNPLDPELSAGGSSGGAAAAVAAGVVPVAHASDCAGSIRIPASVCGLYGLKPGRRTIPAPPDDPTGWGGVAEEFVVSRTLRDSRLFWQILSDQPEAATAPGKAYPTGRQLIAVSVDHWAGAAADPLVTETVLSSAEDLEGLGHQIEPIAQPVDYEQLMSTWHPLFSRWIGRDVARLEAELGRTASSDTLEPLTLQLLEAVAQLTPEEVAGAEQTAVELERRLDRVLGQAPILLTPTLGRATIPLGKLGGEVESMDDYLRLNDETFPYNYLFNVAGWPSLNVPVVGADRAHPIGVQLSARPGNEELLFDVAAEMNTRDE